MKAIERGEKSFCLDSFTARRFHDDGIVHFEAVFGEDRFDDLA